MNRERAYAQLISKLLDVEFDSIWKRHRRLLIQTLLTMIMCFLLACLAIVSVWAHNQPVNVKVRLNEISYHNTQLPPLQDALVKMELANEIKTDTIESLEDTLVFSNIPHKFINEKVRVLVMDDDYVDVDTLITLSKEMIIDIRRDSLKYGNVRFRLRNQKQERFVAGVALDIAGQKLVSDDKGVIQLYVPLKQQQTRYEIKSDIPLESYSLYVPCGINDIVEVRE